MGDGVVEAAGRNVRPARDEGRADAPFAHRVLVEPPRGDGGAGPLAAHHREVAGLAAGFVGVAPVGGEPLLRDAGIHQRPGRTGAVVRQEEHIGVVEGALRVEVVDHAADLGIHELHHRGVDLHPARVLGTLFLGTLRPRRGVVGEPSRELRIFPERRVRGNEPKGGLTLGAGTACGDRPGGIGAAVAIQPSVRHLQRIMRRGERQIREKRGVAVALPQVAEQRVRVGRAGVEIRREFRHPLAVTDILRHFHRRDGPLIGEVAGAAGEQRERS